MGAVVGHESNGSISLPHLYRHLVTVDLNELLQKLLVTSYACEEIVIFCRCIYKGLRAFFKFKLLVFWVVALFLKELLLLAQYFIFVQALVDLGVEFAVDHFVLEDLLYGGVLEHVQIINNYDLDVLVRLPIKTHLNMDLLL